MLSLLALPKNESRISALNRHLIHTHPTMAVRISSICETAAVNRLSSPCMEGCTPVELDKEKSLRESVSKNLTGQME
jgi:hypothetical protein